MRKNIRKPNIRFRNYNNDWEQRMLRDMGETYNGLSGKTKEDFGIGDAEFVTYLNVFNNSISDLKMTENVEVDLRQNEVKYGDILFTTSSETPDEVGMSSVWLDNRPNVYLNSFCFGYRPRVKLDPLFMAYKLRSNSVRKQFVLLAQGISRYNISKIKAMDIVLRLPSLEEQEQIGSFFKELDNRITLHQRKLNYLESAKTTFLNMMFPKKDACIPEFRFAKYNDVWEQRKLSELYNFSQGMQVAIDDQSSEKTPKSERFIRIVDVTQADEPERYIINETGKGHVDEDDIFFVRYGAVGTVGIGYKGTIANNLFKLKPKEKLVPSYMYQYFSSGEFNNKLLSMSASTSMPAINFTALNNLFVRYPSIKEQIQIGTFFQNLDNLIALHQRKLEGLEDIKKYYLKHMFV